MAKVCILTDRVANQIAAGEVIERPAAVVKELVENALDAGATRIEVEFRHGGRSLMRVEDNGHGMSRDDALLSLERQATSKIAEATDLDRLAKNLGDRSLRQIEIRAYAGGADPDSRKISLARALVVRSYLIDKGVRSKIEIASVAGGGGERVEVLVPKT